MSEEQKVTSLAEARQQRIEHPKEGQKPPPGYEQVRLIACMMCKGAEFQLTHDHRIACAACKTIIAPLAWYDVNDPPPSNPAA